MSRARHAAIQRQEWQVLAWLHALMGIGAIGGGVALATGLSGMPDRYLDGSFFPSYVIPGLALAAVVGGASAIAAAAVWRHAHDALDFSLLASVVLAGWMLVQLVEVGLISWLQPFILALLAVQVALALQLRRHAYQQ